MFIKVSQSLVVNTDNVRSIQLSDTNARLRYVNGDHVEINLAAASFLLSLLEVTTAFDFSGTAKDYEQPLTDRLAQTLRDSQPYGATVGQLEALMGNSNKDDVFNALCELAIENVVTCPPIAPPETQPLWFHVSHAPACSFLFCKLKAGHAGMHATYEDVTPNPDLLSAAVAPELNPEPDSES